MKNRDYIKGRLVVTFKKDDIFLGEAKRIIALYGFSVSVTHRIGSFNLFSVSVPKGREEEWKRKLKENKKIQSVSLKYTVKAPKKK